DPQKGETVVVTYTEPDGTVITETHEHVTKIVADGGYGNNTIDCTGVKVPCVLSAEGGDNLLLGGDGNDTLTGGPGQDTLIANGGDNVLNGGSGDDCLVAGGGNDTLSGGAGHNILQGGTGMAVVRESGFANYMLANGSLMFGSSSDPLTGISQADLTGGSGARNFDVSGWTGTATLTRASGQDGVVAGGDSNFSL